MNKKCLITGTAGFKGQAFKVWRNCTPWLYFCRQHYFGMRLSAATPATNGDLKSARTKSPSFRAFRRPSSCQCNTKRSTRASFRSLCYQMKDFGAFQVELIQTSVQFDDFSWKFWQNHHNKSRNFIFPISTFQLHRPPIFHSFFCTFQSPYKRS